MTLRTRMTLWYAGILCASTLLIGGVFYHHMREEQRREQAEHARRHHQEPADEREQNHDEDEEDFDDWWHAVKVFASFGVPAALLGLAGGWWLMRKAMRPVTALTAAAAQMNEKNLSTQLPRSGNGDELDRMTEVFNAMTRRLDGSFQQVRDFTLHASHELKTPLTILRGETETTLREETLSPAQKERLLSQLDELERLTKIVDGLTFLTKADAGQVKLTFEHVNGLELLQDAAEDARILGGPAKITVLLQDIEPLTLRGDRHRLRQLLLNLTDNAIKYNLPGGRVILALRRVQDQAELVITNTGHEISAAVLPRLFDRFYRGEASHTALPDGCGLGLSIVQWIVAAHQGSIRLTSKKQLTTVTVTLPLAVSPAGTSGQA